MCEAWPDEILEKLVVNLEIRMIWFVLLLMTSQKHSKIGTLKNNDSTNAIELKVVPY